jgi:FNIP Repeat
MPPASASASASASTSMSISTSTSTSTLLNIFHGTFLHHELLSRLNTSSAISLLRCCKLLYEKEYEHYSVKEAIDFELLFNCMFKQERSMAKSPRFLRMHIDMDDIEHIPLIPESIISAVEFLNFTTFGHTDTTIFQRFTSLKHLEMGELGRFYGPFTKNSLPQTLETLDVGGYFYAPIDAGELPSGLKHLHLGLDFDHPLEPGTLPEGLLTITFGEKYNSPINKDVLPSSLEELYFGQMFFGTFSHLFDPGALPSNLKIMRVYDHLYDLTLPAGMFPNSLRELYMGYIENIEKLAGVFPEGLEVLSMGFEGQLLPGILPSTLQRLLLGQDFNSPILENVLPSHLKELEFGSQFNQPLVPNTLPASLEILSIGTRWINYRNMLATCLYSPFDQPIEPGILPTSLKELYIGSAFKHALNHDVLPSSLQILHLPSEYPHPIPEGNFRVLGKECEGKWPHKSHYELVEIQE